VHVTVDDKGFSPSTIPVTKGETTTIEFVRTSDATCARDVVLADLNVTKSLPLNAPVDVPIAPHEATTYAFACGMGMFKGEIVVR
jgi:plastocyanin domain-containing protein